ncbi:unnamed protein product [Durusdinium trenchii]
MLTQMFEFFLGHIFIVLLFASVPGTCLPGTCLPDGILEQNRLHVDDVSGPTAIRLLVYSWPSAQAVTSIADILIRERLGVHSVMNETVDTVLQAALKLSGCEEITCVESTDGAHAALETWWNSADELMDFQQLHPDRAPVDLGSIGYEGEDDVYVSKGIVSKAYDETGNSLDFYRAYNVSHHTAHRYFAKLTELSVADYVSCNELKWANPAFINSYVEYTGDLEGVIEVAPGQYHAKCPNGKFWIAPSCRQNVTECIPVVTSGYGWLLDIIMLWSTSYGLPTALGLTRTFDLYASQILTTNVMFYWWRPDVTFLQLNPKQVIFPKHNADAWAKGDKRTASKGGHVGKLVNLNLDGMGSVASRVRRFLQNLEISLQDVESLLQIRADGHSSLDAACRWVKSNQAKWASWIPVKTACSPGYGLIDRSLHYVPSRTEAVDCGLCVPGRFSELLVDHVGKTRRCTACTTGHYQKLSGETSCTECEMGRFLDTSGQSECALCPLGSYANSTAMTFCERCGDGPEWTTSRLVTVVSDEESSEKWIETEGAASADLCSCIAGWFFEKSKCIECSSGTRCVGGELQLLPGYFSSVNDPGSVFKCYGSTDRCPGGLPGTCARGRDTTSVACGRCSPGLRSGGEAECIPCNGTDYFVLALLGLLLFASSGILHVVSLNASQGKKQTSLINTIVSVNQFVTCLQLLAVMGQMGIAWGEPFHTLLQSIDFLSPDYLWEQLDTLNCFTRVSLVIAFLFQNLGVPGLLCLAPILIHLIHFRCRRAVKLHLLLGTLGLLCVLFVMILCNSILDPFQCEEHPNGLFTLRSNRDTLCNFAGVHLQLCVISLTFSLFPICFFSICSWILLIELPKRLQVADVQFLHSCSFLILRFRPGSEVFALVFLMRNMLFAVTPILPGDAASLLMMHLLMFFSFGLVAYCKPWPTRLSNWVDLFIHITLLLILVFGSFFVELRNGNATMMIICTAATVLMMLGLLAVAAEGLVRHLLSPICIGLKPYRFFLCHHKGVAGSLARWLKLELSRRGTTMKVFIDSDNLTDLTRLFTIVGEEVQTLVIIASPGLLTRKWCVGEMVAARLRNVDAALLTLPNFVLPDSHFLKAFEGTIPEVKELANYGFGMTEIMDTFNWLSTIRAIPLETITLSAFNYVVAELLNCKTLSQSESLNPKIQGSNCLILADLEDAEAVATAHILQILIGSDMMHFHGALPKVLDVGSSLRETLPPSTLLEVFALMICTKDCLVSCQMASWLLEALDLSGDEAGSLGSSTLNTSPQASPRQQLQIYVLPLVAEDFQVPSRGSFEKIVKNPALQTIDKQRYTNTLQAIFFQIALPFAPKVSSEGDLTLKAKQITDRLRSDGMGSLQSNFTLARMSSWSNSNNKTARHM